MRSEHSLPENMKQAVDRGVLKRLPLTFLPYVNQQLRQWDFLFPNERQSVESLLVYVETLSGEQSASLFRDVLGLEEKMGVAHWHFSTAEQTIENASLLARSPYYQEWRKAIQAVFDAADRSTHAGKPFASPGNRLILIDIPRPLELDPTKAWHRWGQVGKAVTLTGTSEANRSDLLHFLLRPEATSADAVSLFAVAANQRGQVLEGHAAGSAWVFDAGQSLIEVLLREPLLPSASGGPIMLSNQRLELFREKFSHELNSMRKDLGDADAVYDRLRNIDVLPWCTPEVAADSAVREFVRNLYLSGNGAVIFGNSFVQWGASEALRRARPRLLAARFGVRTKPKPFTGVAVFDDPDKVNPLPAVDDIPGSATDAQILALYIWLAAIRYAEYQRDTVCLCIAEGLSQAYVVAPANFAIVQRANMIHVGELRSALREWLS